MGMGILIGMLIGISLALGVALYINKGANPFFQKSKPTDPPHKDTALPEPNKDVSPNGTKPPQAEGGKPRFDFYKILPGSEEAVTDKEFKRPAETGKVKDVYFLQVAAFQNPSDADNMKARLALAGIETQIQTATLPDGKVWHRVRLGPFSAQEQINKSRAMLKDNQIEANLIKVREGNP
ncbi:MAG: SPOR domain-containing protein [Burkholderiales bacterium]